MSFVTYSQKTKKFWNQIFLQEIDQEMCRWNRIIQILNCDSALFPARNSPNSTKRNHIFAGKGGGGRTLLLAYLDSSMAEVSLSKYFF